MAIDTQTKRRSAYYGMGVWNVMPVADGTIGTQDRVHARWIYSGIAIAGAGVSKIKHLLTMKIGY